MVDCRVHTRVLVKVDVRIRRGFAMVLVEGSSMWSQKIVSQERVVVNRVEVLGCLVSRYR